jgi:acetyl-CoA carboxylase carboxyltransferase component
MQGVRIYTFRPEENSFGEDRVSRNMHPMMGKRLEIWRLSNFNIEQLPSGEDVYLFKGIAKENPKDMRLFAFAEVRDVTMVGRDKDQIIQLPTFEMMLFEALAGIRRHLANVDPRNRPFWNRILLYIWPPLDIKPEEIQGLITKLAPETEGLGLEKVVARAKIPDSKNGKLNEVVIEISNPAEGGMVTRFRKPGEAPIRPLTNYANKVVRLSRRDLTYPYELIKLLTPGAQDLQSKFPPGEFIEYDLDENNNLVKVDRPYGMNTANIVVGLIRNYTKKYPEGMTRVILLGDPSVGMGNLAEAECRRINAAMELAREMDIPLEWFAVSAGAKISMDSGTENMDWIALVLRRLVEFTQQGGEVNIIVTGINVGAQPYWNAEATMLMHTRGILIMTPVSAMVLTGKQALDYSGGVSAEDNKGIGGYERIMGPNGQAQYFAKDLGEACGILLTYYNHSYRIPGERFPRKATTTDITDRDICEFPHGGDFKIVGEVFSTETNPGRKKPFEIRKIMAACIDQDQAPLERWFGMQDAEVAVVWDAHIGGTPVCLLGLESRQLHRLGIVPSDGPDMWTSGTLFPQSSKKVARSINAASNNRPLVVLANLSGFDGSPESMRKLQLEYGAEIGRAVVNFKGPIIFCVVSRYHGGAFVVFSNKLNDNMEVAALEGTYASVIGGAPAAAVVFAREVKNRTEMDSRILTLEGEIALAKGAEKVKFRSKLGELYETVYSEKLGEVADDFDTIHSVQRALKVGSVDKIIPPTQLRPYLIDALERGMKKELEKINQVIY